MYKLLDFDLQGFGVWSHLQTGLQLGVFYSILHQIINSNHTVQLSDQIRFYSDLYHNGISSAYTKSYKNNSYSDINKHT